jgi:hypothetical protein
MLGMAEVVDAACEYLQGQLHPSNALGIRGFAHLHNCACLLAEAETFLYIYFTEVVMQEEFFNADLQTVPTTHFLSYRHTLG